MKAFFLFAFLSLSFSSFAQKEAVKAVIQNSFDDIFSSYDTASLFNYYTTDFLLLEHGEVWTTETIKNYMIKARSNENRPVRTNSFDFIEIKIKGKRAWVAYHNYAKITQGDELVRDLHWLESGSLIKTKAGWKLELLHSTRVTNKE